MRPVRRSPARDAVGQRARRGRAPGAAAARGVPGATSRRARRAARHARRSRPAPSAVRAVAERPCTRAGRTAAGHHLDRRVRRSGMGAAAAPDRCRRRRLLPCRTRREPMAPDALRHPMVRRRRIAVLAHGPDGGAPCHAGRAPWLGTRCHAVRRSVRSALARRALRGTRGRVRGAPGRVRRRHPRRSGPRRRRPAAGGARADVHARHGRGGHRAAIGADLAGRAGALRLSERPVRVHAQLAVCVDAAPGTVRLARCRPRRRRSVPGGRGRQPGRGARRRSARDQRAHAAAGARAGARGVPDRARADAGAGARGRAVAVPAFPVSEPAARRRPAAAGRRDAACARPRGSPSGDAGLQRTLRAAAGPAPSSAHGPAGAGRGAPRRGRRDPSAARPCRPRQPRSRRNERRSAARRPRRRPRGPVDGRARRRCHPARRADPHRGHRLGSAAPARPPPAVARPALHRHRQLPGGDRRSAVPRRPPPHRGIRGNQRSARAVAGPRAGADDAPRRTRPRAGAGRGTVAVGDPDRRRRTGVAIHVRRAGGHPQRAAAERRTGRTHVRLVRAPAGRLGSDRHRRRLEDDAVCGDPAARRPADDRPDAL